MKASFRRFHRLGGDTHRSSGLNPMTLSLIVVRERIWEVWFSHDKIDAFELYGPFYVGSTETLMNTHKPSFLLLQRSTIRDSFLLNGLQA